MGWTSPRTWVTAEIITAALGNTHWRDNLRYLKGQDGSPTFDSSIVAPGGTMTGDLAMGVDLAGKAVIFSRLDAAHEGGKFRIIRNDGVVFTFDMYDNLFRIIDAATVRWQLNFASGEGTLEVGVVPTARLKEYAIGSYTGNDVMTGRQITTGFQCKFVFMQVSSATKVGGFSVFNTADSMGHLAAGHSQVTNVHLHASDGFVVGDGNVSGNVSGEVYYYIALGE